MPAEHSRSEKAPEPVDPHELAAPAPWTGALVPEGWTVRSWYERVCYLRDHCVVDAARENLEILAAEIGKYVD